MMARTTRTAARLRRHARVRRKVAGTAERPRLNVFRSAVHIYAQVIDDREGRTLAAASDLDKSLEAEVEGKNKTERAGIVGRVIAERAREANVGQVIFDRGGYRYHGRVKALAAAARESGLGF
ncbi:MAG: 50S ribosomal protein L18 [Dehalococcoidia bacterium]